MVAISTFNGSNTLVKMVMVICQNRKQTVKIRHYNINIYLYIVSNDRVSEIENDHLDLDHFDHTVCTNVDVDDKTTTLIQGTE